MQIVPTSLPEVIVLEPDVHSDDRGFLIEAFQERRFAEAGLPSHFVQENHSRSRAGVVRALHYQLHNPQGKLVTAMTGEIFDVAVDIRVGSPRFGQWTARNLRGDVPTYMWIPAGFAHGFAVLSESADVLYKCTAPYDPADTRGVLWNDPGIGIPWPVANPVLSADDRRRPRLETLSHLLPRYVT